MKNLIARLTLTAALSTAALFASPELNGIAESAGRTHNEAREISTALKSKKADLAQIKTRLATLEQHATEMAKMVEAVQPMASNFQGVNKAEFERMTIAAKIVTAFVENKKSMIEQNDAAKNLSLLRMRAEGIASRAAMVQKAATRLKG